MKYHLLLMLLIVGFAKAVTLEQHSKIDTIKLLRTVLPSSELVDEPAPPIIPGSTTSSLTINGSVILYSGWNLVSSPVNGTVSSSVFNKVAEKNELLGIENTKPASNRPLPIDHVHNL